ncbi:MAG: DUF4350 domain-containing protein [Promethearchaeota archaeon]
MRREYLFGLAFILLSILVIPPLQPAPFTLENTSWNGLSDFKSLISSIGNVSVSDTTTPLRLLGNVKTDMIIIVGGSLPYFTEDSNYLRQFVENGGDVILFEDHGYSRILTSAFGITLGGTVIDQDFHDRNPFLPIINQSGIGIPEHEPSIYTMVFNRAVRVQRSRFIEETTFFPLFITEGKTWEDMNHDGRFYRTNESVVENCYLGGILRFEKSGGKFIVIGDSAFPTNDIIDKRDNQLWLVNLLSYLIANGNNKILFDESRKLWIPPTGKAAIGTAGVLIMGVFHSPLIAIITLIILGGIIGIKKTEKIHQVTTNIRSSLQVQKEVHAIPAFIQSEEENELGRLIKRSTLPDLYRAIIADEIRLSSSKMSPLTRMEYEDYLMYRYIDVKMSKNLIKQIQEQEKRIGEKINGSQ